MSTAAFPRDGGGGPGGQAPGCIAALNRIVQNSRTFRMWVVIWILAMLVLAQYSVSTAWLSPNEMDMSSMDTLDRTDRAERPASYRGSPWDSDSEGAVGRPSTAAPVSLDALEEAVKRLAQNDAMAASLGSRLLQEVASLLQPASQPAHCDQCGCTTLPGRAPPTPSLTPLYVVTPTYRRPEQIAELTRMSQTLLLVRNLNWIVIEDAKAPSKPVAELLKRSGLPHAHLIAAMPDQYRQRRGAKPKGVAQRNRALQWLRANATTGVFYFADDDNSYDVSVFEEIRTTKRVSMFPVGLCTSLGLSTPIVSSKGTFAGFYDGWLGGRKFPVDMAGFAVNVKFLLQRPKAQMPFSPGFEEDGFLRSLAPFEPKEIELKADNCTKVLVWHTQTKSPAASPPLDMAKYGQTNIPALKAIIV